MTKATVQIPKDTSKKHKIVIPREIWEVENLQEGDYIEIDIKRLEKKPKDDQMMQEITGKILREETIEYGDYDPMREKYQYNMTFG